MIDTILVAHLKKQAERGFNHGAGQTLYMQSCKGLDRKNGAQIIFTRDTGMHSCGWWKNPDYERCFHLSFSCFDPLTFSPCPLDKKLAFRYCKAFFGDDIDKLWCEPPFSDQGKHLDVWHYRLFVDEAWEAIKPRGEVYSRELTEKGYRTFSEIAYHREREYNQSHE